MKITNHYNKYALGVAASLGLSVLLYAYPASPPPSDDILPSEYINDSGVRISRSPRSTSITLSPETYFEGKRREWLKDGQYHRDDGPAIEWENGARSWYRNGQMHRDDGPAQEHPNGYKAWFLNGQLHRDGGPAIEYPNGAQMWYRNGQLHRDDGPAVEHPDGTQIWYRNGKPTRALLPRNIFRPS